MERFPSLLLFSLLAVFLLTIPTTNPALAQYEKGEAVMTVSTTSAEAEAHFWKGMHDAENIFFTRAVDHFKEALSLDPDFALARLMHALFEPGLNQMQRLEKVDGALTGLSGASTVELLVGMAAREGLRGNNAEQLTLLEAAAELAPDDPHVAMLHVQSVGAAGPPERTADALREMVERFPDEAAPHNQLAYLLWARNDEAGAREAVTRYMELAPDHPNAHDSYAELMQFSGMYNQALMHYQKAVELDAGYFAGYTGQAEAYSLMGQGDQARAALRQAEAHAATDAARANLQRGVANTYFMEGNTKEGMKAIQAAAKGLEAVDAKNQAAQAYRELAVAEAMFGKAEMVEQHLEKAAALQTTGGGHHFWATIAHGMAGHKEATREAADAFAGAVGKGSWTHALNGLAHLVAGEHEAAEAALLASNLDAAFQRAIMARCQKEMGHEAQARAFSDAVMADSGFTVYNLGFAFARLSVN